MPQQFEKKVVIQAYPATVWANITQPRLMKKWMGPPEMELAILTNWEVGRPIVITGFHHARFENKGVVLQYDANRVLQYTHLSSASRLPDIPGNASIITFTLQPQGHATALTLSITGFATDTIYHHLAFYWRTALELLKKAVEDPLAALH